MSNKSEWPYKLENVVQRFNNMVVEIDKCIKEKKWEKAAKLFLDLKNLYEKDMKEDARKDAREKYEELEGKIYSYFSNIVKVELEKFKSLQENVKELEKWLKNIQNNKKKNPIFKEIFEKEWKNVYKEVTPEDLIKQMKEKKPVIQPKEEIKPEREEKTFNILKRLHQLKDPHPK